VLAKARVLWECKRVGLSNGHGNGQGGVLQAVLEWGLGSLDAALFVELLACLKGEDWAWRGNDTAAATTRTCA
jgi:hypothetical protein